MKKADVSLLCQLGSSTCTKSYIPMIEKLLPSELTKTTHDTTRPQKPNSRRLCMALLITLNKIDCLNTVYVCFASCCLNEWYNTL